MWGPRRSSEELPSLSQLEEQALSNCCRRKLWRTVCFDTKASKSR